MSAPLIWIFFPGTSGLILFFLQRWHKIVNLFGIIIAILLAIIAWQLPIGEMVSIGPQSITPSFTISETLFILGRKFTIEDNLRPILVLIFVGTAFWFGGAYVSNLDKLFIPIGLIMTSLMIAAISVEPFLYAALIIEISALMGVIILSPPGTKQHRGVLRFLTFQTMGMAIILTAGWFLTGVDTHPGNIDLIIRLSALIGLGFALFMAIFPFHSWIPILTEEANPYAAAFVFFITPQAVSLFLLIFLSRFTWLGATEIVYTSLRTMGILMVLIGGIWAAFQNHLGRIMGFAVMMEIGFTLLALSILDPGFSDSGFAFEQGINLNAPLIAIFLAQFLPRLIALAVWALALNIIKTQSGSLMFDRLKGYAYTLPFASISVIIAAFSIAGLPLLAGFPLRIALWAALIKQSPLIGFLMWVGIGGLFIAGIRSIALLASKTGNDHFTINEKKTQILLLISGWIILVMFGTFPQLFIPLMTEIANIFSISSP